MFAAVIFISREKELTKVYKCIILSSKEGDMNKQMLTEHTITTGHMRFIMRILDDRTQMPNLEITVFTLKEELWHEKASFMLDCDSIWAFGMLFTASLHDFMLMWDPACRYLFGTDDTRAPGDSMGQKVKQTGSG